jgi:hypothetical protein
VLAATAVQLHLAAPLDVAAKACEPLFGAVPVPEHWFPVIDPAHARAAIAYATRAVAHGQLTQDEADFVCTKARRVIMRGLPQRRAEFTEMPS